MEMRNNINISPTHLIYKSTITFIKPTLSSTNLTVVWNVCVSFFHGNITKQATIIIIHMDREHSWIHKNSGHRLTEHGITFRWICDIQRKEEFFVFHCPLS